MDQLENSHREGLPEFMVPALEVVPPAHHELADGGLRYSRRQTFGSSRVHPKAFYYEESCCEVLDGPLGLHYAIDPREGATAAQEPMYAGGGTYHFTESLVYEHHDTNIDGTTIDDVYGEYKIDDQTAD